jgi:hypothetical protein
MKTTRTTTYKTSRTRGRPVSDERQFRELGALFLRATDPDEQSRLKTELVRSVLRRLRTTGDCGTEV